MGLIEIRPGEGGADAASFADTLAASLAKHTGATVTVDGTTRTLHRL